eukprot:gene15424-5118_t
MLKAISEAYELMMAADENGDHELSQLEAANSAQLFHASKLFNWGAAVHTDLDQMYQGMAQRLKRCLNYATRCALATGAIDGGAWHGSRSKLELLRLLVELVFAEVFKLLLFQQ